MTTARALLVWSVLGTIALGSLGVAASSPLLAWREPVYIVAGLAGVAGLTLMLFQPLLVAGLLPGLPRATGRKIHQWSGTLLLSAVALHVASLWITSPPDVVDALLLRSPTPFSIWGVLAMWALLGAAALAATRRRGTPRRFRLGHSALVLVVVAGTIAHALLIEGTMGTVSKFILCLAAAAAITAALARLKPWSALRRRSRSAERP